MRHIALALATLAAAALAACGDDTIVDPPPRPGTTTLTCSHSGGIAGVIEILTVDPDGQARLELGAKPVVRRFELEPAELERLRKARADVDFASLRTRYGSEVPAPDSFTDGLDADGRRVTIMHDGDPPAEVSRLLGVCRDIVERRNNPEPVRTVPGPSDSIVTFYRGGGEAGRSDRMTVRPDGAARFETGFPPNEEARVVDLSPAELDELRAARAQVDFGELEEQYGSNENVADAYSYGFRADGKEVVIEHEGDPPPELARLLQVCIELVDTHAPR